MQSLTWYSKAAKQGNPRALFTLWALYYRGEGVPKYYAQAVAWYRKAAEHGHVCSAVVGPLA